VQKLVRDLMKSKNVLYFTPREEEFADLLIRIGIRKNVAKVLVYLAHTPEATSREIERGTDLRQPEVSIAMAQLMERFWVESRENKAENKGRPVKIYRLSRPIGEVMDTIEREKREEANTQLNLIQQLRDYIS
jgi:predicted transcriptional regulator